MSAPTISKTHPSSTPGARRMETSRIHTRDNWKSPPACPKLHIRKRGRRKLRLVGPWEFARLPSLPCDQNEQLVRGVALGLSPGHWLVHGLGDAKPTAEVDFRGIPESDRVRSIGAWKTACEQSQAKGHNHHHYHNSGAIQKKLPHPRRQNQFRRPQY